MGKLSHTDSSGAAHMVDITNKEVTHRVALAQAIISLKPETINLVAKGQIPKGDTLSVARTAAIMAIKRTSDIIPLCHPLPISGVSVDFHMEESRIKVLVKAKVTGKTGVEMEALTGASVAALTIYDMVKAVDKEAAIGEIRLLEKEGGKSGHFKASML